jgi:hypothetical protein
MAVKIDAIPIEIFRWFSHAFGCHQQQESDERNELLLLLHCRWVLFEA